MATSIKMLKFCRFGFKTHSISHYGIRSYSILNILKQNTRNIFIPSSMKGNNTLCHTSTSFHHFSTTAYTKKEISSAILGKDSLEITIENDEHSFPYPWLRDNCQCDLCYDHQSYTRKLLTDQWDVHKKPTSLQVSGDKVELRWNSGGDAHVSVFDSEWLKERSFLSSQRDQRRNILNLKKIHWDKNYTISKYDFNGILNEDEILLKFLMNLEIYGISIITNTPKEPKASFDIINKIGFIKRTHYGIHYPIRSKSKANSLAYTDSRLGMHNDLPYYDHIPGIIFLHCIYQIGGEMGGVNQLVDGFRLAKIIQENHPEEYELLTKKPVYFWNKGSAQVQQETKEFLKLLNVPVIMLDMNGDVKRVNNSQLRDSYLDLSNEVVGPWYKALHLYNELMMKEALYIKLNSGEVLVMDNTRLLHGRTAYNSADGERYMDQVYLDWDEALSKRRVLMIKHGIS